MVIPLIPSWKEISSSFDIVEKNTAYRPEHLHEFGMYLDSKWYKLTAKKGTYNDQDWLKFWM